MDAVSTSPTSTGSRLVRAETVRAGVLASVGGMALLGLLVVSRRAAGALSADLPAGSLLATVAMSAAIVFGGRVLWRRTLSAAATSKQIAQSRLVAWLGTLALWLLAAGCSLPQIRLIDWLAWLPVLIADQVLRQWLIGEVSVHRPRAGQGTSPTSRSPAVFPLRVHDEAEPGLFRVLGAEREESEDAEDAGEELLLLQQFARRRDAEGAESITGSLHAEFAVGQRTATLHVGFCPPLESPPTVDAEIADGPDAAVKVVQAYCHGARLEVRLAESAEEACGVVVEFVAAPSAPLARRG